MAALVDNTAVHDIRTQAETLSSAFPPLLIEAERIAHTVAAGLHGRRRAGPGEMFWQHRPYAFGDPVSTIDWRQSARAADRLYVRQNEWEAAAAVWISRDPSRSLNYASIKNSSTKRQRADVMATALAILLAEAGERVGLAGARRRPFHGRGAPALFLEALNVGKFDDSASAPPEFSVGTHSRIVFISDFFSDLDAVAKAAERCAAIGASGTMMQIIDPAEEQFPYTGRTEFEDLESHDKIIFGDAGSVRSAYRREFAAHRQRIEQLCKHLQWTFIAHRTDAAPVSALLALYLSLSTQGGRSW